MSGSRLQAHAAQVAGRPLWRGLSRFVGPGCITASALVSGAVAAALVIFGLGMSTLDFVLTETSFRERQRQRQRVRVEDLLEVARDVLWASGSKNVRVNVMLADADTLRVEYKCGNYAPEEVKDPWARGVGCAGMAYDRDRVVLGTDTATQPAAVAALTLADADVEVLHARPTITAEHIASVMSVPVRGRDHSVMAVINVDDRLRLTDSALIKPEIIRAFERMAVRLADVLDDDAY
ncbi:MAG TPA: hypothetical protein VFA94_13030 [Acidimicrobiales bacterium]|nr:hypothetical protein [Acidimicrobiales bacterium]